MKLTLPNQLTIFRIIATPVFCYLIIQPGMLFRIAAFFIFLFASLSDWYDGYLARRYNLTSRWGQFMDPLADKILVSAALVVFAYMDYIYWWMVILVVFRDFLITFLRSFAVYVDKPIVTSSFAKGKTVVQMTFIFALLLYMNIPLFPEVRLNLVKHPWIQWTTLLMSVVVLLTLISGIHYLIANRDYLKEIGRRLILKNS